MVSEAAPSYNERGTRNHPKRHLIFGTLIRWIKEMLHRKSPTHSKYPSWVYVYIDICDRFPQIKRTLSGVLEINTYHNCSVLTYVSTWLFLCHSIHLMPRCKGVVVLTYVSTWLCLCQSSYGKVRYGKVKRGEL